MNNNSITLVGNVGEDPELRFTNGGTAVLKIRMATESAWFDKDKVEQKKTAWHTVVVWGPQAEALGALLKKGSRVVVAGEIEYRSWDKPDGGKGYATEVRAEAVGIVPSAARSGQGAPAAAGKDRTGGYKTKAPASAARGKSLDDEPSGNPDEIPY